MFNKRFILQPKTRELSPTLVQLLTRGWRAFKNLKIWGKEAYVLK